MREAGKAKGRPCKRSSMPFSATTSTPSAHCRCRKATGESRSTLTRPTCSPGCPAGTRTRASRLHLDEVPIPELGPGEALVAVMASAINYNTVWTSIFEPVPDVRIPASGTAAPSELAKQARPALPRRRLGPGRRRAARPAPGVNKWKAGRRGRRALPVRRARGRRTGTTTR